MSVRDLALAIALVSRWVCVAMACAKCAGQVEAQSFKKCEGSAVLCFSLSLVNFFKVQVVCEAVHLSPWEIFVRKLSSVFCETQICAGPITANFLIPA